MLVSFSRPGRRQPSGCVLPILLATFVLGWLQTPLRAQEDVGGGDAGACTLKDHIYTCDGAVFQKALAAATTVRLETHNADGVARAQLSSLVTKKLGKTIAPNGAAAADLDFLLIPVGEQGVNNIPGNVDLGTLRIYSVAPDGTRSHLLWAETCSGEQDTPWPVIVRTLVLQFQSRFHIK